jgi:hypothetical protein
MKYVDDEEDDEGMEWCWIRSSWASTYNW